MSKLLVILGPTATGKTDLALQLASKFQGELVSADSRQVYVGLDVGTGKLPGGRWKIEDGRWKKHRGFWEINGVKIWMYDVVSPKIQYTVANYVKDANRAIGEIRERGKLPIIVGGTGLYLKSLLDGLSNLAVPVDKKLRKQLEKLSLKELQQKLQLVSIKRWKKMNRSDRANPRRLIRAIELSTTSIMGRSPRSLSLARDDTLKVGLTASRDVLYKKVDKRVVSRIKQGMVEETEKLHNMDLTFKRMKQLGLEYGVLADYLAGTIKSMDSLIKIMQNKIHGFVRRQLTWFKKEKNILWFDITNENFPKNVEKIVTKWYHQA